MRRATSGKGFSYGARTPPDPFADPLRGHALDAHPRPHIALWLTASVSPKRGRYASASITNALVVARAVCCARSVLDPREHQQVLLTNLRPCPSATRSWRTSSISARGVARPT